MARAAEGFSIFDIFAPTQENPRTRTSSRTSTIGGLRTIERKEKRAIEYQIFLEISSSYLARSSIVIVLVLVVVLVLENPDRFAIRLCAVRFGYLSEGDFSTDLDLVQEVAD